VLVELSVMEQRYQAVLPTRFVGTDGEPVTRISENTVRDLLKEARRRGLLSPAPRGRAGGFLTDHAKELLAQPPAR
jgi:hypothetical protein